MPSEGFGLCFCDLGSTSRSLRSERRDDETLAIRGHFELGFGCDFKQIENRAVDNDARAIADSLETLDHAARYNTVVNVVP
jgi:hypothetical protein